MDNFEIVIFLMTILIALSAVADKIKLPYPILLVLVGLVIGFVPFLPNLDLDPDIVFLIFLPPLLYDAASKTSWHDFKREIRPISALAISLVFFTTVAVAATVHYLIPGFSWPLGFVLGAIISPPDAVAAAGITKGLGLNRKVITIIEGESLVNDASALIAYRYAVAAAISGTFVFWKAGLEFLWVALGGIAIGIMIGYLLVFAHKKIDNNPLVGTSLTLLTPFVAYILAERFHMSGVLAVVTAGLFISFRSGEVFSSETRLQANVVWDTVIFLLNGIIFILIGLQMPTIVEDLHEDTVLRIIGYGLIVSFVTIAIRILWVFAGSYNRNLFSFKRRKAAVDDSDQTSWKNVLIVAWTGTRGVVSLATALALPLTMGNGTAFPKRHTILLLAFVVILVTLVVQGLSLPLLIKMLKIQPVTGLQKREEIELQQAVTQEILNYLQHDFPLKVNEKVLNRVSKEYEMVMGMLNNQKGEQAGHQQDASQLEYIQQMIMTRLEIVKYERELLIRFHKEGTYSDQTINKAERELDLEELRLQAIMQRGEDMDKGVTE